MILFAPQRPLMVRLHVKVDRVPFRRLWQERIDKAFTELDADGDGQLSADDSVKLARQIAGPGSSANETLLGKNAAAAGGCTRVAARAHFQRFAPPLSVREAPSVSGTAIFEILDANRDRRLSVEELRQAEQLLRRRDFNDDQVITADELLDDPRARSQATADPTAAQPALAAVLLLGPETPTADVAARLLAQYDRDRDGLLAMRGAEAELSYDAAELKQLLLDAQGHARADDVAKFCQQHVDLELFVALGAGATGARGEGASGDFDVRKRLSGDLKIEGRGVEIEFRRNNRNPARNSQTSALAEYDSDGNGYLDEAECQQAAPIAGAFASVDADHNGQIFADELDGYLRQKNQAASTRLVLQVSDLGQDLFDLLDTSSDRQLSLREILAAPRLIALADRNGDGLLAGQEIVQRIDCEVARASADLPDAARAGARAAPRAERERQEATGPAWFAGMDRNQDGDVSPREFLGPAESFQQLDVNHDGLIDAAEAEKAAERHSN